MTERDYWIGFSVFPGIGPRRFKALYTYFGSAKAMWNASISDLCAVHLGEKLTVAFDLFRRSFDPTHYSKELLRLGVQVVTLDDEGYPGALREICDAPFVLYVRGDLSLVGHLDRAVAVVGTRHMTHYGESVVNNIVPELVRSQCVIVSGMAYGVDAAAHWAAIHAGGKTLAVLGSGIDIISPPSNARLYHEIWKTSGAIISEMPLGHRPLRGLFPARNRIISGLSRGVVVIEGAEASGSLITARMAAEQGRDVCAVPGPITSLYSRGPHRLLKNGAILVEHAGDVLEALGVQAPGISRLKTAQGASDGEQRILDLLREEHLHINDLVTVARLTISDVAAILTVLEMKGMVKDYGDKIYGLT